MFSSHSDEIFQIFICGMEIELRYVVPEKNKKTTHI